MSDLWYEKSFYKSILVNVLICPLSLLFFFLCLLEPHQLILPFNAVFPFLFSLCLSVSLFALL